MLPLRNKYTSGFTLIEILVASLILFSSFAAVALLYRGALLSSEKAANHLQISATVPEILAIVQHRIRNQSNQTLEQLSGEGVLWAVKFEWQAELESFQAPAPIFDIETAQYIEQAPKYKRWQVNLVLNHDGTETRYDYLELSWNGS